MKRINEPWLVMQRRDRLDLEERKRSARNVLRTVAVAAVLVVSFLGVMLVSGCELIYFPECDSDCAAAAGSDTYSRGN